MQKNEKIKPITRSELMAMGRRCGAKIPWEYLLAPILKDHPDDSHLYDDYSYLDDINSLTEEE